MANKVVLTPALDLLDNEGGGLHIETPLGVASFLYLRIFQES